MTPLASTTRGVLLKAQDTPVSEGRRDVSQGVFLGAGRGGIEASSWLAERRFWLLY
jgi:hypothetical protein